MLEPMLFLLALLVAFRGLFLDFAGAHPSADVFAIGALPTLLVLPAAVWIGWRRTFGANAALERAKLFGAVVPTSAWLSGGLAVALLVWSRFVDKTDLLFPALGLALLAGAGCLGLDSAFRRLGPAVAVLLFGVALPRPLESEIVWRLQLWSAGCANQLLRLGEREFKRAGVILRDGDHTFHVIESCSGLTGILILLLMACLVRELLDLDRRRSALLFSTSIFIGFAVNVVRVAYVAGSPNPEELAGIGADHTSQGVAVLMIGTALVYGVGLLISRGMPAAMGSQDTPSASALPDRPRLAKPHAIWILSALLVLGSVVPVAASRARRDAEPLEISLPASGREWQREEVPAEPLFNGRFVRADHARYVDLTERGPLPILDVFVGQGVALGDFGTRSFSSKRFYPGPDWNLVSKAPHRAWALGRSVDRVIAAPNAQREHAVLYTWMRPDRSLLRASWIDLFRPDRALGNDPEPLPILVRIVAYAPHGGELVLDRAEQRIERFVRSHPDLMRVLSESPR